MKRILVLGSLNMDLVQHVSRLPVPGETLKGSELQTFVGGKGANQACAAALLGGNVQMAGNVGNDAFADRLLAELRTSGVDIERVRRTNHSSGTAVIFVLPSGENLIVISPGANADISPDAAVQLTEHLSEGDLLLCQLETPLEAVEAAISSAFRRGILTILDPAPACDLPDSLLSCVCILTPNQTELAMLAGLQTAPENFETAEAGARVLQRRGAHTVIVKMGSQGCVVVEREKARAVPGFCVDVCDTTAAGDTFNGALAAALSNGSTLFAAVEFANAAAALAVTKTGAIASIPALAEVQSLLSSKAAAL